MCEQQHQYNMIYCPKCGRSYCWNCCGGSNVQYAPSENEKYMLCPKCKHNYYQYEKGWKI